MNTSIKIVSKKNVLKNGLYPIYLRVTIDRKSKFYSTPFSCKLSEWNENQGEFTSKFRNHLSFNKTLRKMKDSASDVINLLEKDYESYNLILFDKYYSQKDKQGLTLCELFQKEIEILYENGQISYSTSMNEALKALQKFKKDLTNYKFENIDFQFLTDFENFLRKRGANDGGIGVYMRNIRKIYNKAINYKIVQPQYYPFRDFKISKYKKRNIRKALTEKEFEILLNFNIEHIPSAKNAKYLYIFSYYARGMNFTDLAELKWSDMENHQFNYNRNKTDVLLKVKLPHIPIIDEILQFYKIYRPSETPYIFPILNKKIKEYSPEEMKKRKDSVRSYYNRQLKEILKLCEIDKNITFYTARHTFATTALRKDVNINIIKQSLGHKRLSTTENYLDDFKESEVDDVIVGMF
ncbi:Tyrosine recombinase XerD [Chryseobacterium nakagawai]|uniref:Site-specific integrase n=1 Tax=Chryseobacterium nakagawai TaxID=1241982 RepID=A0AAD0YNC0_CHRNA|nr:site-specific integrase [Chryseobacterium nakagawai]AZA92385.1 site-specific integrase [Chryseobacterium nakagawai]VEH18948.1 Tyrosine recombinase XerD [Chryseobacterium nakagawai]